MEFDVFLDEREKERVRWKDKKYTHHRGLIVEKKSAMENLLHSDVKLKKS